MRFFGLVICVAFMCDFLGSPPAWAQDRSAAYTRLTTADLKWNPLPSMGKGAQIAVLYGNPAKSGLFAGTIACARADEAWAKHAAVATDALPCMGSWRFLQVSGHGSFFATLARSVTSLEASFGGGPVKKPE